MNLLSKYIFKQVTFLTLALTFCLVGLAVLARSLSIVDLMVNRGLSFNDFLYMLLLLVPSFLQVILPIALAIACLFTYNKMHSDNEMMILHSSGVRPSKIAFPTLLLTIIVGVVLLFNSSFLMPSSFDQIAEIKGKLGSKVATSILQPRKFINFAAKQTVYFEDIRDGQMRDLIIRDESNPALPSTTLAQSGKFVDIDEKSYVVLTGVEQMGFSEKTKAPFRILSERQVIEIADNTEKPQRGRKRIKEMTLPELFVARAPLEPTRTRFKMSKYIHAGLSAPILSFGLVLLIINLMINVERSRKGLSGRITVAVLLLVFFSLIDVFAESAIGKDDTRWFLVYANALLLIPIALVLPKFLRRLV